MGFSVPIKTLKAPCCNKLCLSKGGGGAAHLYEAAYLLARRESELS